MTKSTLIVWLPDASIPQAFELGEVFTIGRHPTCTLQLCIPQASRVHATLVLDEDSGRHLLHDGSLNPLQRSKNGVYVNGKRILAHLLRHGEEFHAAGLRAQYTLTHEPYDGFSTFPGSGDDGCPESEQSL